LAFLSVIPVKTGIGYAYRYIICQPERLPAVSGEPVIQDAVHGGEEELGGDGSQKKTPSGVFFMKSGGLGRGNGLGGFGGSGFFLVFRQSTEAASADLHLQACSVDLERMTLEVGLPNLIGLAL